MVVSEGLGMLMLFIRCAKPCTFKATGTEGSASMSQSLFVR